MGHEAVHPDEPEPWVYSIGADEVAVPARPPAVGTLLGASNGRAQGTSTRTRDAARHDNGADLGGHGTNGGNGLGAEGNGIGPAREARPMPAPGLTDDGSEDEAGDAESLLRELHSLAALDDALAEKGRAAVGGERNGHAARRDPASSAVAPPPLPRDATPPVPKDATPPVPRDATPDATPPRPTRGDPSAIADAFAELSALDLPASTSTRAGAGAAGHAGTSTSHAGANGDGPTPPDAPAERRNHTDAAGAHGGGGLSALFSEGPLFDSGDEPPPTPERSHERADDHGAEALRHERTPDQEYEATLHVVASPARAQRSARRSGTGPRSNGASPQHAVPPPTPLADRGSEVPEGADTGTNGHPVPTPDTGNALDLSSFTAKGGPGARRAGGRRRRLAR
jgi:hypothetical protein